MGFCHHLNRPSFLPELHRVCRTDARCIFTDPIYDGFFRLFLKLRRFPKNRSRERLAIVIGRCQADGGIIQRSEDSQVRNLIVPFSLVSSAPKIGQATRPGLEQRSGKVRSLFVLPFSLDWTLRDDDGRHPSSGANSAPRLIKWELQLHLAAARPWVWSRSRTMKEKTCLAFWRICCLGWMKS